MNAPISIVLVDDHALVRDMLVERLEKESGMTVVGTASNGDEAVTQTKALEPDVVLMDIDMPGLVCFEAARTITMLCPDTLIIYLSAFFHDRYIEDALAAHAIGYVTKDEAPDVVIKAIRHATSGVAYFSPKVASRIVIDAKGPRLARCPTCRSSLLTQRECEVLRYIARGMSKKEIAEVIHLAVKTVERHCCNLMDKLDIHDRVELARYAIRGGIVEA